MKTFQRIASFALALVLCFAACAAVLPAEALAASTTVASGTCGDNLTWTLDNAGTLTISGKGEMANFFPHEDYATNYDVPWYSIGECQNIQTVVIESGVTSIGHNAFSYCSNLTSVIIPDTVTSIGRCAFAGCSNLASITIPDSVIYIGSNAFSCCTSLNSVIIPHSVIAIGDCAFSYCTDLRSVYFMNSGISVGDYAFTDCDSLQNVYYSEPIGIKAFLFSIGTGSDELVNAAWHYSDESGFTAIPCTNLSLVASMDVLTFSGQLWRLVVKCSPYDTTDTVIYTSGNESVVTVDENGCVTAVGEGETVIIITCGSQRIETPAIVKYASAETGTPITNASTAATTATATTGTVVVITEIDVRSGAGTSYNIVGSKATGDVVTVLEIATVEGYTWGRIDVGWINMDYVTRVDTVLKLKKTDVTFSRRGVYVTLELENGLSVEDVTWSTSDSSVATVYNGNVTAIGKGYCVIRAEYEGQVAECVVHCDFD